MAAASPVFGMATLKVTFLPWSTLSGPLTEGLPILAVFGGGEPASTVKLRVAGDASTLPAASTARNATLWAPPERPENAFGDVQSAKSPESSLHCSFAVSPGVPWNVKVASAWLMVPEGPESIIVSGAVVSGGGVVFWTVWFRAGEVEAWNRLLPEYAATIECGPADG